MEEEQSIEIDVAMTYTNDIYFRGPILPLDPIHQAISHLQSTQRQGRLRFSWDKSGLSKYHTKDLLNFFNIFVKWKIGRTEFIHMKLWNMGILHEQDVIQESLRPSQKDPPKNTTKTSQEAGATNKPMSPTTA